MKNTDSENWVIILTLKYTHHIPSVQQKLSDEGIKSITRQEKGTFLYDALEGEEIQSDIRILVREEDAQHALQILQQSGYLKYNMQQPSAIYQAINQLTGNIPYLNKLRFEFRFLILLAAIASTSVTLIYFKTRPTTVEKLLAKQWCVNQIIYKGQEYQPYTRYAIRLIATGACRENIILRGNGITFPGFNSRSADAIWELTNDSMYVTDADTFGFVYNGVYAIDFSANGLQLKSATTTINCQSENIELPYSIRSLFNYRRYRGGY